MHLKHLPEDEGLTPSEIAAAIVAVEARRTGNTGRDPEATLADVLRQISPDLSPEEVRAEVAAQRAVTAGSRRRTRRLRAALASVAAILVAGSIASYSVSAPESSVALYSLAWPQTQQRILAQDTVRGRPILRTLAEVPDNRVVLITADAVQAAVTDEVPRGGGTDGRPLWYTDNTASEMTWRVFKLDNHLYVRGWTRERLSPSASKINPVEVYDTPTAPDLGPHPVQISVRLTPTSEFCPFVNYGVRSAYLHLREQPWECFCFSSVRNDAHTWEAW